MKSERSLNLQCALCKFFRRFNIPPLQLLFSRTAFIYPQTSRCSNRLGTDEIDQHTEITIQNGYQSIKMPSKSQSFSCIYFSLIKYKPKITNCVVIFNLKICYLSFELQIQWRKQINFIRA